MTTSSKGHYRRTTPKQEYLEWLCHNDTSNSHNFFFIKAHEKQQLVALRDNLKSLFFDARAIASLDQHLRTINFETLNKALLRNYDLTSDHLIVVAQFLLNQTLRTNPALYLEICDKVIREGYSDEGRFNTTLHLPFGMLEEMKQFGDQYRALHKRLKVAFLSVIIEFNPHCEKINEHHLRDYFLFNNITPLDFISTCACPRIQKLALDFIKT